MPGRGRSLAIGEGPPYDSELFQPDRRGGGKLAVVAEGNQVLTVADAVGWSR
jgi:hypothetical protein